MVEGCTRGRLLRSSVMMRTSEPAPHAFPSSLSPSRAADFTTCPLLFRFRSIDRLPETPSPAAVRGTVIHRALEWLFDLPAARRTQSAALDLVVQALRELEETAPQEAEALRPEPDAPPTMDAEGLLTSYFGMEDPRRLDPHAREVALSATIEGDFEIRGIVDRIDRTPDGLIRIVDYKTGRSPSEAFAGKAMFQMRFYALAWWRMTGDIPARLQLMYLGDGRMLRLDPDAQTLESTERRILALRRGISHVAETGDFSPSPSRLCDWCSHRALCPAWGGSPPDLPPREEWPTAMASRRSAPSAGTA